MVVCFTINGKKICIYIPLLIRQWLPPWVPIAEPTTPSPWKWLQGEHISEATQRDILTIGLISELAKSLSPDKGKAIQAAAQSAIHADRDLPKGMTVSF